MIIRYKVIQACVKILYQCMLLQASLLATLIILFPICYCDWSRPFSAWVTEISDCSVFPVVTVIAACVRGTDSIHPSVVGLWQGCTRKEQLTSPTCTRIEHLRLPCMTSLSVNRREEIWQLDHWVGEWLPWRSHSEGCGQWFNVQVESSGEWCPSGVATGTRAAQHLCQWHAQGERGNFWVRNDKHLLCMRQRRVNHHHQRLHAWLWGQ